jgi:DNA-binding NarL/FixJ family response regulator
MDMAPVDAAHLTFTQLKEQSDRLAVQLREAIQKHRTLDAEWQRLRIGDEDGGILWARALRDLDHALHSLAVIQAMIATPDRADLDRNALVTRLRRLHAALQLIGIFGPDNVQDNHSTAPVNGNSPANTSMQPRESAPLTSRERQVLRCIGEGHSTKQAAQILGITFKTAACHRYRIMEKLDIHDTATLVRYAIREGLVEL